MEHARRVRLLAPLAAAVVIGAVALTRPADLRAGDPPWDPPPCPPGDDRRAEAPVAWFSLDPQLDATGTLTGQRLTLGTIDGSMVRAIDLPPESFATGPVGGRILVGDDDGTRSRLRFVDVAAGCAADLGIETSVVRSAILSPDGRTAWEHRVDRASRADLGVWRRSPAAGATSRVLPPLPDDPRFGPTFSTELGLADDGRLTVASCGELACRLRVLDPRAGRVRATEGTGPLIGLAGDRVIAWAPCHGFPCRIDAVDLRSGRRSVVVEGAGLAALGGPGGRALAYETASGALAVLDLPTMREIPVTATDALPVRPGSGARGGADVPPGWVLVAPGGHVSGPATTRRLDVATGDVRELVEVER
jgi:hypothetical protein